jgi:hypothetical protein
MIVGGGNSRSRAGVATELGIGSQPGSSRMHIFSRAKSIGTSESFLSMGTKQQSLSRLKYSQSLMSICLKLADRLACNTAAVLPSRTLGLIEIYFGFS